jgi:ABC-type amino acid transport substrate-binding protein
MDIIKKVTIFLLISLFNISWLFASQDIVYSFGKKDLERIKYNIELIKMILDNAHVKHNLYYYQNPATNPQLVELLKSGKITVAILGSSIEKEKTLIPVRIPVFKGLLGYRIFLINKKDQRKFNNIKSFDDLKQMVGAQGIGWLDNKILKDAGLKLVILSRDTIDRMLNEGNRIDYFARAVYEAFGEIHSLKTKYPNIVVEKKILIVYPFAMYFYVSPKYPELAKKMQKSFQQLVDSGKFDKFFYNNIYIKKAIRDANLSKRLRFDIPNNYLSEETKKLPPKYWIDFDKFK